MSFKSLEFLIFFPVTTVLYFLIPHRFRWALLLAASCIFYIYFIPVYIFVIFAVIAAGYIAAIAMENRAGGKRKACLAASLLMMLSILFIFKYFDFFNDNIGQIARFLGWNYGVTSLKLLLPIGLSFHAFQSMSYIIEVYRGKQKVERNLGIYALYVMFYPQLVAGPIERPQHLLPQFYEEHFFEYQRVIDGLKRMLWGFFKKIVIADRMAIFVTAVYDTPSDYSGIVLVLAAVFFSVQVYCDFSGYTDIAIGAAQVLGFELVENFRKPFSAGSVSEFWRRWHISLSSWLYDYVYTPLAVRLRYGGVAGVICAVMVTWTLIGVWHGANWTFVVFGILHGTAITGEVLTARIRKRIQKALPASLYVSCGVMLTFGFFCFSQIFFRAPTITAAWYILSRIAGGVGHYFDLLSGLNVSAVRLSIISAVQALPSLSGGLLLAVIGAAVIGADHLKLVDIDGILRTRPVWLRLACYIVLICGIVFFGAFETSSFVYFQF